MSQKSPKKVDLSEVKCIVVLDEDIESSLAINQERVLACPERIAGVNDMKHTLVKWGPPSTSELKRDACRAYPGLDRYYNFYPRFEGFKKKIDKIKYSR